MFKKKGLHSEHSEHSHRASTATGDENQGFHFSDSFASTANFQTFNPNNAWAGFNTFGEVPRLGLSYDIYQEGDNLIVEIPFPRLNAETLSITQENRLLRVSGTTDSFNTKESKTGNTIKIPLFIQTPRGTFEQIIQLPLAVHEEETEASYQDGVLTITLKLIGKGRENKINVSFAKNN